MVTHPEFINGCSSQDIELFGRLAQDRHDMYGASKYLRGMLIGEERLSSDPIPDLSFCTDAVAQAHALIINTSHQAEVTPELVTDSSNKQALVGCADAEGLFATWLAILADGPEAGGSIVVDDQDKVVAINKRLDSKPNAGFGEESTLLLQNVAVRYPVRGRVITLPRGSLVYMEPKLTPAQELMAGEGSTIALRFGQIAGIGFMRMTGLDLSKADRLAYYRRFIAYQPDVLEAELVESAVEKAMRLPHIRSQLEQESTLSAV